MPKENSYDPKNRPGNTFYRNLDDCLRDIPSGSAGDATMNEEYTFTTLEDVRIQAINEARNEIAEMGMVTTTTFINLNSLGLDALLIVNKLEEETFG